jgi:uncharacterized membrane protein YfcA
MHFIWLNLFMLVGGIAGGLLSSIASMASLASYPVLLMSGVPPLYANVTNDAALIWTGIGSTAASLKELHGHWHRTLILSLFTTIGSAIGCWLLLAFPSDVFTKVVPFFIAFSGVMILVSDHGKKGPTIEDSLPVKLLWLAGLLIMGMYSGYFGAASGVVVLIVLTYMEKDENFLVVNAMKNVVCGLANATAFFIYLFTSRIYWDRAIPMAVGMLIGGWVGPRLLRHLNAHKVKIFIAILAFAQAGYYFYTAYLAH